jgi:hypothetical protein
VASSVGALVAKRLTKVAKEVSGAERPAVNKASLVLKKSVERELLKVAPSRRLKGVGRKGARVGVRYDIKGKRNFSSIVRATGPMHLIERSTRPHVITAGERERLPGLRRGAGGRFVSNRRRGVLRTANGMFRRSVRHPGTRGRYPFAKGIKAGKPEALKALRNAQTDALKRGFR